MKKIFFYTLIILFSIMIFPFHVYATQPTDIKRGDLFYDEIIYLIDQEVIAGFPDGTFRANEKVTRAQAALMIGRALELDGTKRNTPFSDVNASHQASGYIASAAEAEIIKGYTDGSFRPNEYITRGKMAIFLARAFELNKEAVIAFSDVSPQMASYSSIKKLLAAQLTQGYPDNTFRPQQTLTRGQFAAFVARGLNEEFKQETPLQYSYLRDTAKVYHFATKESGPITYQFSAKDGDWNRWHVYENGQLAYVEVDREDVQGYYIGYPESEFALVLSYPVEKGRKWDGYGEAKDYYHITGVDLTVETPAGLFRHVVEVTTADGLVNYYAPGAGIIKQLYQGEVQTLLVKME